MLSLCNSMFIYMFMISDLFYISKSLVVPYVDCLNTLNKCKSWWQVFKDYRILTVTSLYISEVLCYIKRYKGNLKQNLFIHGHNKRCKLYFQVEIHNTILFQKSVVNMWIQLYNKEPEIIKKTG
jgi:hypothetical protein